MIFLNKFKYNIIFIILPILLSSCENSIDFDDLDYHYTAQGKQHIYKDPNKPAPKQNPKTTSADRYKCSNCGSGFSYEPVQCILYVCTTAKTVASGLAKYCSCSCGVASKRRQGYSYSCG